MASVIKRVQNLINGNIMKEPRWLACARRAPPAERNKRKGTVKKIVYPEDRLRRAYFKHFGSSHCIHSLFDDNHKTHVDRFVDSQLSFMEQGMGEKEAFKKAERERVEFMQLEQAMNTNAATDQLSSQAEGLTAQKTAIKHLLSRLQRGSAQSPRPEHNQQHRQHQQHRPSHAATDTTEGLSANGKA